MSKSAQGSVEKPGTNVNWKAALTARSPDQGWSGFGTTLRYKLAERGGELVEVDPRYTSRACAECGVIA